MNYSESVVDVEGCQSLKIQAERRLICRGILATLPLSLLTVRLETREPYEF
jgi:hypothetical protein